MRCTSMPMFSSILKTRPNRKMNCARFANSHILRRESRMVGSSCVTEVGADVTSSISTRPLFREEGMAVDYCLEVVVKRYEVV